MSRARWQRVVDARRQSRDALGLEQRQPDELFDGPPKKRPTKYVPISLPPAEPRRDESIGVLTLGEAAARLGVSRRELEAMIAAGKIEALPTRYTRTIPTSEIKRLQRSSWQVTTG